MKKQAAKKAANRALKKTGKKKEGEKIQQLTQGDGDAIDGVIKRAYARILCVAILMIDRAHEVPKGYQRDKKKRLERDIKKIGWSYALCGALSVAKRPDGTYHIVDGQQRYLQLLRLGIKTIPCIIIETTGEPEVEAELFVYLNTKRTPVTPYEIYIADLLRGVEDAVLIDTTTNALRFTVSDKGDGGPRTVQCVQKMRSWARRRPSIFVKGMKLCALLVEEARIDNRLINGICYLEQYLQQIKWPESIFSDANVAKLRESSLRQVYRTMKDATFSCANNVAGAQANGLMNILNVDRKKNILPLIQGRIKC